jgi:hypothetical protein
MKIKIIGAGLFGCTIGYELHRSGHDVTIIEQDSDIMMRASKCNHNRIHFGYHYPRCKETARQSLDGLISFYNNYKDAIVTNYPNYYMIAKHGSNVTPDEYLKFCHDVNINYLIEDAPKTMINSELINLSIRVDEPCYDYDLLKSIVREQIKDINVQYNCIFNESIEDYDYIINTTYAGTNHVHKLLGAPPLNIKLEDVVIPIFGMKHDPLSLTIMDGPFCGIMPKGKQRNKFLLYNVKHSRINGKLDIDTIYKQSQQYLPFLKDVERLGYWRTKRALYENDSDSRISEIFTYKEHPKLITVLSGKLTTCHKIAQEIKRMI